MRIHRALTLVLMLAAACTAEVAAPRSIDPSTSAPTPSEAVHDVLYVRQAGNGSPTYITRIDAATGGVLGALPDGVISADRATLYRAEPLNGATQTRLHEIAVATGEERRAFTIDGDFALSASNDGPTGLSSDGRWLVLSRRAVKINNEWVSGFAVVDIASGAVVGRSEFKGSSLYFFQAIAPDGASLLISQSGDSATRLRIWDVAAGAFLPDDALGGWDGRQQGFTTAFLASRDARRLYWLDTANGARGPLRPRPRSGDAPRDAGHAAAGAALVGLREVPALVAGPLARRHTALCREPGARLRRRAGPTRDERSGARSRSR